MQKPNKNSNPVNILDYYKSIIWSRIEKYLSVPIFPRAFLIPKKYKSDENFHWKIVQDYPKRKGKYIRPTLVSLTAQAMGVSLKKTIQTAAGMQISEDWLLIHDDWEDNSTKRRGLPALHRLYSPELAVNAGDALHNIMWKIFVDNREILGKDTTFNLLNEFHTQLSRTVIGQTTEIAWTQKNRLNFTDSDWYFIADGKTSYYTIACPMRLGAIIAGANRPQLEKLAEFGIYLGRCFQLVDDVLDITGDFGGRKEFANDIYEGKRTVILGHLLRNVDASDKKKLALIMAKGRDVKTKDEVLWVIDKMKKYGSIDHARTLAEGFRDKARKMFERDLKFLSSEPARSNLKTLINFILERQY